MSRIAIFGATSQIARDFIDRSGGTHELLLYARRPEAINGLSVLPFADYGRISHDAIINFVGAGSPAKIKDMGSTIFDVTQEFDTLALSFVKKNKSCRYIFLSSGVASGRSFLTEDPASSEEIKDLTNVAAVAPQDYYSAAKFQAESRHSALADLPIVDIRVFNYFSRSSNLSDRFFITDLIRALKDKTVFKTSAGLMVRDYMHPDDFHQLIELILTAPPTNKVVDGYSRSPIDKITLLKEMEARFGLRYEITEANPPIVNATGAKPYYYSTGHNAADFGYKPKYSSVEGLIKEISALLAV